jgi:hypothetical protein
MVENLPEDEMRNEDDIKHQALIDNTAQGIFNHLKEIENKREIYEKRWIWELLQNALDAAPPDRKIEVEITYDDDQLIFRHNGRLFKPEEVAHLIYHGSTKRESDIGKFGTGFLTTHLLSKKVRIKGVREDHKRFEFELNREGRTSDEIKKHMEETWEQYKESLTKIESNPDFIAEYKYPLNSISLNTVKAGIEDLTKIAPYVLAFNDKLGVIKIKNKASELKFELVSENNESAYIKNKRVKEERGKSSIFHELRIVKSDDVEIAINGKTQDDKYQIESLQGIPKIFVAFPLFGTQDLPFPVVVNSRKFEPTEKRDGIFLGKEDTDDIKRNKELLENTIKIFVKLISDSDRWENIHTLLNLEKPPDKDWLDRDWYITLLKQLIEKIKNVSVVKTEDGSFKPYTEVLFPSIDAVEKEKIERLWELCYSFSVYKDKLPARELAFEWSKIINGWESLDLDLTDRQITIEKIATEIEKSGRLQDFKIKLGNDVDEIDTLNDFYRLLLDVEKRGLFDTKNILPDQNGNFKKKPNLFKDEGIDETLKDISNKLGIDVRNQLLHSRITENVKILLQSKKQEEVLNQVINKIKQSRLDDEYLQANIELFNWLLENDKFEYFEGYPILSSKEKIFTPLSRKDKVLAPKEVWNETARIYADLFPQDFIISSDYFKKISEKDKWDKLRNSGFVLTDPIYKETEKINGDDLALLSTETLEEDKEHGTVDDLEINKIAFFEVKDKGIIDTVRKSKDKARKFLGFLFDYIIENDTGWDNPIEVSCKCGSKHKIYASLWLGKLKERSWIPVRKDKSEQPNAKNLAMLLKDDEKLLEKCRQDKPSRLLARLNISRSELMMNVAAKDDKIRIELDNAIGSLLSTYMTNPSKLSRIAQLAESEPELFLEKMEAHLSTREQIRRNQSIGSLVEKLLKSVLEKEGFKVEVTGAGSDFVIEHDFVKDNVETIFEVKKDEKICSYIEVKATSQDFVRMSLTQAQKAKDKVDKYVLCVIPLNGLEEIKEEDVKNRAKFIMDVGQKIQDKVTKVENFKKVEQEAVSEVGDIEIEISEGPIRFKINKTVWEDGKTFEQFLEFLRGMKI